MTCISNSRKRAVKNADSAQRFKSAAETLKTASFNLYFSLPGNPPCQMAGQPANLRKNVSAEANRCRSHHDAVNTTGSVENTESFKTVVDGL